MGILEVIITFIIIRGFILIKLATLCMVLTCTVGEAYWSVEIKDDVK
jgi:hypothetical protein